MKFFTVRDYCYLLSCRYQPESAELPPLLRLRLARVRGEARVLQERQPHASALSLRQVY